MFLFCRHITQNPGIPNLIICLYISPKTETDEYIPIMSALGRRHGVVLPRLLTSLERLSFQRVDWRFPRVPDISVFTSFLTISDLHLRDNLFHKASDLFFVIWRLPHLTKLALEDISFSRGISDREFKRLERLRPTHACRTLRKLRIWVTFPPDVVLETYIDAHTCREA